MLEEKIELLYKILIQGSQLNDNSLMNSGLNYNDIITLIQKRIIEPTRHQDYKLVSIEKFRQYGVKLLLTSNLEEANKCFEICYELSPYGKNICLQAFLVAIKRHDYTKAMEIFSRLEKIQPEKNTKDNNLYLYLLSITTKLPEEYTDKVKTLTPDDLMLPDAIANKLENEMRKYISQNKFPHAYKKLNMRMSNPNEYSIEFELIKSLLIQAIEYERSHKKNLLNLAKKEKYTIIKKDLKKIQERRNLSKLELSTLLIVDAIIHITETKTIPEVTIEYTDDMQKALLGNNYKLALKINESFLNFINSKNTPETVNQDNEELKDKHNTKENAINILIVKLNNLILELEEKQTHKKEIQKMDKELSEYIALADYLSKEKMTIEKAQKKLGILHECALMIKLIYARNYFEKSDYIAGNILLEEIEQDKNKTGVVISLLEELKNTKKHLEQQSNQHTRSLKLD